MLQGVHYARAQTFGRMKGTLLRHRTRASMRSFDWGPLPNAPLVLLDGPYSAPAQTWEVCCHHHAPAVHLIVDWPWLVVGIMYLAPVGMGECFIHHHPSMTTDIFVSLTPDKLQLDSLQLYVSSLMQRFSCVSLPPSLPAPLPHRYMQSEGSTRIQSRFIHRCTSISNICFQQTFVLIRIEARGGAWVLAGL